MPARSGRRRTIHGFRRIQILTIEGLLNGTERPNTPPLEDPFAKAPKADSAEQIGLPTVS
jgi:hypothetical protein